MCRRTDCAKNHAPRATHFPHTFCAFVPVAGIITCLCLMIFLPADTWIRLVLWMLIGLDIYSHYAYATAIWNRQAKTARNAAASRCSTLSDWRFPCSVSSRDFGISKRQDGPQTRRCSSWPSSSASPISSTSSCDSGTTPARADNFFIITYSKSRQTPVFAGSFWVCYRNFCQDI